MRPAATLEAVDAIGFDNSADFHPATVWISWFGELIAKRIEVMIEHGPGLAVQYPDVSWVICEVREFSQ
jgi:hypothetical protein